MARTFTHRSRALPRVFGFIVVLIVQFTIIGNVRANEVEQLIKALGDVNVRQGASIALVKRGKDSVSALRRSLAAESSDIRIWSAYTLGEIGAPAHRSVAELTLALSSQDAELRAAAAQALGKIRDASSISPLTAALKDKNAKVRSQAAIALGTFGEAAKPAVKSLITLFEDDVVRVDAKRSLIQIGSVATSELANALADDTSRFDAAQLLLKIAPNNAKKLGLDKSSDTDLVSLRNVLFSQERAATDQKTAANSLASIGPKGIHVLIEAFENLTLRRIAAEAFVNADSSAAKLLVPAFSHKDANIRASAALAVEHMKAKTSAMSDRLIQLLKDNDRNVRYRAVRALHSFGKQAKPAVPALSKVIADSREQEPTRQWAIKTLIVTLPETHDAVVKGLIAGAQEKQNYGVRQLALQFLRKIDPKAAEEAGL